MWCAGLALEVCVVRFKSIYAEMGEGHSKHDELLIGAGGSDRLFGSGRDPVFLGGVTCAGMEENILDCRSTFFPDDRCKRHRQDLGVVCLGRWYSWILTCIYGSSLGMASLSRKIELPLLTHNDEYH